MALSKIRDAMRFVVYIGSALLVFLLAVACMNNKANVGAEVGADRAFQSTNLIGRYEGNLPCADCGSIATTLIVRQDRTYSLHYIYVGKSDEQFHKTGNWNVDEGILYLDNEDYNYKITGDKLNQLDLSGMEMKGNLASKYTLRKVD